MKKSLIILLTHVIFILHIFATLVILFGALVPNLRWLYQFGLILTIISWVFTSGCFLTSWEYKLRKIVNPKLQIYEHGFIDYYLRKYLTGTARPKFIYRIGLFFLVISLVINIYTHGFVLS